MSVQEAAINAGTKLEPVTMLGLAVAMPVGSSLRLDQPCGYEHGSIGGWCKDDAGEVSYTLLWRPPAYWTRDGAGAKGLDELQHDFVEQALAGTRKDSRALTVEDRAPMRIGEHEGELVDTTIQVRRKVGRVALRRRQALWTCATSGRHLAFEVSTLLADGARIDPLFDAMLDTVRCHPADAR